MKAKIQNQTSVNMPRVVQLRGVHRKGGPEMENRNSIETK